jgi:amino acid permease
MKDDNELQTPLLDVIEKTTLEPTFERIEEAKHQYYEESGGSIIGSVFCLLCLTFGSGILALPYSFTKIGIGLGLVLYFLAAYSVYWTLNLLTKTAYKHNVLDYSKLINIYYGSRGVMLYEIMNLLSNLGAIVVYQQISKIGLI